MTDTDSSVVTDVKQPADEALELGEAIAEEIATSEESSTEPTKESQAAEEEPDNKPDDPEKPEEKPDEPEPAEDKPEEVQQKKDADSRKQQLNNEIRELVSKRNELRASIEHANQMAYRTETQEELVEAGMEPNEARAEVAEQQRQFAEYNAKVTDLNASLNIESTQILADFPVFDPESKDYDPDFESRVRSHYQTVAQPRINQKTGLVEAVNVLPYDVYKTFAEIRVHGQRAGAVNGQKAAEKMYAAAEPTPTGGAPAKDDVDNDPFMRGFNSI
jgi:outer membrane biosynthesis protein TonB